MCRLLVVSAKTSLRMAEHLRSFARVARASREYQGDGWGCAYLVNGQWHSYRTVRPIWDDDLDRFPPTTLLLAHARSASACGKRFTPPSVMAPVSLA